MGNKRRCPASLDWYSCPNGFQGCCSVWACDPEGCPDSSSSDMSTESATTSRIAKGMIETIPSTAVALTATTVSTESMTKTMTTKTEPTTKTTTIKSSTPAEPSAEITTTTKTSTTKSYADTTSATSTPMSETISTQPTSDSTEGQSHDQSNAKMIGAIVGGVMGLLLILCLISYLLCRLRKQRGRRRFTLLHWQHRRLDHSHTAAEEGDMVTLVQRESFSGAASSTPYQPEHQLQSIPEEQSLGVSPLQGQADLPQTDPEVPSSSPNISPQSNNLSLSPSNKANLVSHLSGAIHPALRHSQPTCKPTATTYPNPITVPKRTISHPRTRIPSSPRELFDTGFRLGRLELPAFSTRELINIPFAERQRQKQQKHLKRTSEMHLPIVTRDGALLSATFDTLPTSPDCHAISFADHGPVSPSATRKRAGSQSSSTSSRSSPLASPPLSPSPPSYRSSWRHGSSEVKEKVMEKFRKKS
ncbi:hypothetical protein BDV18DRAFT_55447 [Aspergillus unguis]